ncbi:phage tail sheath family protein [Parapedobacter koreensis]|uniref:Tail sheath protein C-terminal domain-containing protein n=1 Tax=Parapedobacter koreensis TaxID=332977 RepID=A0A1H7SUZ7_9SPHI|nr:phage tail sheath C-terminal domain-containing protein [Parapedobacter koreensis]SEL76440.1 hypothetical protein SAMN05421740_109223 [Parapedobacter koreensis]
MAQINEVAVGTPGVYVDEIAFFPPTVNQVETAVPAFIGYTRKAEDDRGESLINKPTKVFSLQGYERYFGGPENQCGIQVTVHQTAVGSSLTSLSVRAELAADSPSKFKLYDSIRLYFANGGGPCYVVSVASTDTGIAVGPMEAGLNALTTCDEPTIIVLPDGLSLTKDEYYGLIGTAIDQCALRQDRFTLVDVYAEANGAMETIAAFRSDFTKSDNLNFAAAYYPYLKTTLTYTYNDTDVAVVIVTNGIAADAVPLGSLKIKHTAIYNLCVETIDDTLHPTLAPSAAMAGIYARVDGLKGVWKAPANVMLNAVSGLSDPISEAVQGLMNIDAVTGKSVNAIRAFQGKGYLVWGARTLAGNDSEWRYVNVRRLAITVEKSARKAAMQFVFEPNDANTWTKLRAMLDNYLLCLWRRGALVGNNPEHAFYVRCGLHQTMTVQDVNNGKLIVEIGMAVVRPAEFVILRFAIRMRTRNSQGVK